MSRSLWVEGCNYFYIVIYFGSGSRKVIFYLLFRYFHCHGIHLHAVTAGTPEVHTVSYYLTYT